MSGDGDEPQACGVRFLRVRSRQGIALAGIQISRESVFFALLKMTPTKPLLGTVLALLLLATAEARAQTGPNPAPCKPIAESMSKALPGLTKIQDALEKDGARMWDQPASGSSPSSVKTAAETARKAQQSYLKATQRYHNALEDFIKTCADADIEAVSNSTANTEPPQPSTKRETTDQGLNSSNPSGANSCSIGKSISGRGRVRRTNTPVLNGPSESSGSLINQTASAAFRHQMLETLSPSEELDLLCESSGYVQVVVTAIMGRPRAPPALKGWVKQEDVSTRLTEDQKRGLFWDFSSSNFTPEERSFLRTGALKVLSDNKRCLRIDSGRKSSSGPKQYYVTCGGQGDELFNVFFDKAEAIGTAPLTGP